MQQPKILVTGGTGFIGSHTVLSLMERGYEVVVIDNLSNSTTDSLDGIANICGIRPAFHQIDLLDIDRLESFLADHSNIQAVIHFAALKAVGESVEQPVVYYQNNLIGLLNLLLAMQKYGVSNLIFSSSATVYGEPDQLPVKESHPVKPASSPYGNTKKISEDMIEDTTRAVASFRAISLRYFNPIGAHESAEIGELPLGVPSNLMPFITQTAAGIRKELLVFGNDYNTPDGTAIRDYIHVVDLAQAHVAAVERLLNNQQKAPYEVFNLGTGRGYSVLEVIQSFENMSGQQLNYRIVERRSGDIEQTYASTDLAKRELGWTAQKSLDEMTASAWKWQQKLAERI